MDPRRTQVTQRGHVSQRTKKRDRGLRSDRQHTVVTQQHTPENSRLARQCPVFTARHDVHPRRRLGAQCQLDLGSDQTHRSPSCVLSAQATVPQSSWENPGPLLPERHLQVLPRRHGCDRVAQTPDEICHHETLETPLLTQDLGQEVQVLACPLAVHAVVCAHHRVDATLDHLPEVREVHAVQGLLVDLHVDGEPGVLHGVQRIVLDAGQHPRSRALRERRAHCPDQHRLLAVRLL